MGDGGLKIEEAESSVCVCVCVCVCLCKRSRIKKRHDRRATVKERGQESHGGFGSGRASSVMSEDGRSARAAFAFVRVPCDEMIQGVREGEKNSPQRSFVLD